MYLSIFLTLGLFLSLENIFVLGQDLPTILPQTNSSGCDFSGALKCFSGINSTADPFLQTISSGHTPDISASYLQTLCMSLQDGYYCIGSKLDACPRHIHLLRDVILSGSRYICNEASQDFLDSLDCLYMAAKSNMTNNCGSQIDMTEWSKYFTGEKNIFDNEQKFCDLASTWSSCYLESLQTICDAKNYDFVHQYMTHITRPVKTYIGCDVIAELPTTSHVTTPPPTVLDMNECDIPGARTCMEKANVTSPMLSIFGSAGNTNLTADELQQICMSFQNVYFCIGSKLDGCNKETRLLRDVIVSGTRYICNAGSQEFLQSLGCMNKLSNAGEIRKCFKDPIGDEWNAYFGGVKSIFDNYDDFCSIATNLTLCYMDAISSLCNAREYNFIYNYWIQMSSPLEQCYILKDATLKPISPSATNPVPEPTPLPTEITIGQECMNFPCFNDGVCIQLMNGYKCLCHGNTTGLRCQWWLGGCPGYPCYNGGSCLVDENGPKCLCPDSCTGKHCQGIGGCPDYPCYNNGTCQTNDNGPKCICPENTHGDHCEDILVRRECDSSPCYNGGSCVLSSIGYKCQCPSNTAGNRCQLGIGGCPGFPCYNGGSCLTDDNGPRCLCPGNFPGEHCQGNVTMFTSTTTTPFVTTTETPLVIPQYCYYTLYTISRTRQLRMNNWCTQNCRRGFCPSSFCSCHDAFSKTCSATGILQGTKGADDWCTRHCQAGNCPRGICRCQNSDNCSAVGDFRRIPGSNGWCSENCKRGNCPRRLCRCRKKSSNLCFATGAFKNMPGADNWCTENCLRGSCPRNMCRCKGRF